MQTIQTSLNRVLETRAADQMPVQPYALPTADGGLEERYWSADNTPILGPHGEVLQILSAVQDVTAEANERRSEEARGLLMREVDHRARNALTVVQSVVRLTEADDIARFKQVVLGRVEALARAQTSLARRRWEGADLAEVIGEELASLASGERYRLSGPPLLLRAEHVQAMSMVLHELATNATKYGALSMPGGAVSIDWSMPSTGQLALAWRETGGPPVTAPQGAGFGSRLIAQLSRQLGGEAQYDWRPDGLVVGLSVTL
jgi:two-component sensor histidine kinase